MTSSGNLSYRRVAIKVNIGPDTEEIRSSSSRLQLSGQVQTTVRST